VTVETREAPERLLSRHARHHRSLKQRDERRERALYLIDLRRARRRATAEIEANPRELASLRRAVQQAHEGLLISQDELDRELAPDDE
jgi:hypothetical protein